MAWDEVARWGAPGELDPGTLPTPTAQAYLRAVRLKSTQMPAPFHVFRVAPREWNPL